MLKEKTMNEDAILELLLKNGGLLAVVAYALIINIIGRLKSVLALIEGYLQRDIEIQTRLLALHESLMEEVRIIREREQMK